MTDNTIDIKMPVLIKKRSGKNEKLDINKIHKVLSWATEGLKNVSVSDIEVNASLQLKDGIKTSQIHKVLIESAVSLISAKTPNYQFVASRLLNYYIRKETFGLYTSKELPHLNKIIEKNVKLKIYDKVILEQYTKLEIDSINDYIHHDRDFNFAYAGIQQMVDKYLLKDRITNILHETPQYTFMVIAMTVFGHYPKDTRIDYIRRLYNQISLFKINLPTPILCGIRTPLRQYSSCTLIDIGDSLPSIFSSNTAVGYYTAKRAGIGLNIGRVRAIGSSIRNGEVVHTGLIPYLKMLEATTKCTTQNGVRGGSSTTYYPFWHYEVEELLVLKNNKGNDENRIRKMDYGIQLCRLFYKRVKNNEDITLFSPSDVNGLYDSFGDNTKFEELYLKYEKDPLIRHKKINARDLFSKIAQERIETGRIYIMNIDHTNEHSSFKDHISMSNLCVVGDTKIDIKINEITQITTIEELFKTYNKNDDIKIMSMALNNEKQYSNLDNVFKTGETDELIEITDEKTGKKLTCTLEHKIYTKNRGYVEAKHLNEDDELCIF